MSQTIWKFPLETVDEQQIEIPIVHKFLYVDNQYDRVALWAQVEPMMETTYKTIIMHGTGHAVKENEHYIGSCILQNGRLDFVWHVYVRE